MKTFLIIVLTLTVGFLFGYYLKGFDPNDLQKINPIKTSCSYDNKVYKSGESFKSTDGCNSCSCQGGQVACTLMACLPD